MTLCKSKTDNKNKPILIYYRTYKWSYNSSFKNKGNRKIKK